MDNLSLLIVDDELGMRLGVVRALRSFQVALPELGQTVGFDVEQAENGTEGLARLNADPPPDICLLDHKLPDTTGLEILDQLAQAGSDVLAIMVTAYASLDTAVIATKRGAYDFLAKPFTPDELKAAVRKATKHLVLQREARRLADEKRQIRFQFISVLAHEMKAPLAAVEGYLRIVRERAAGNDPAVYDRMLDRSLVRLDGMRKLILDLLDMTAIESGRKQRDLRELDLAEMARDVIETFEPQAAERQITVRSEGSKALPMVGDAGELEIILNNLVSNAVKYNRDGGTVTVRLAADTDTVTLEVSDTGIGMSPEECAKLFADFVRIKNANTRSILGSGLGLSTVKKIAQLYGGNALVTSQPDVGSTFTVTLKRGLTPNGDGDG